MANSINIPKAHLIMGLCMPLAVLLGYFLAEPLDSGTIAAVVFVLVILSVPLLMKWHHPLLVLSWNACIVPYFVPGQPLLWLIMAVVSLFFAVLNRSARSDMRFISPPNLVAPLVFLFVVVFVTAFFRGGIGLRAFGAATYGGRSYFYIFAAILGFFALTSMEIPRNRRNLYVAMFFLSGVTGLVPNIAYKLGSSFYFLFALFPVDTAMEQVQADYSMTETIARINGLSLACPAVYCYLLGRHGVAGSLDIRRPWRPILLIAAAVGCFVSGFRSVLILFALTFFITFWLEGLHRTWLVGALAGLLLIGGVVAVGQLDKMPYVVQRSLSFLPVPVDPLVHENAAASTEWRITMWKRVVKEIPRYLLAGKGYAIDPSDLFLAYNAASHNLADPFEGTIVAGDFHNGPLSVIIPLGIWGVIAFVWLMVACFKHLIYVVKHGDPELQRINTFLLALFAAHLIQFLAVFGSFYMELFIFTGIAGLSVSLNGLVPATAEEPVPEALFEAAI